MESNNSLLTIEWSIGSFLIANCFARLTIGTMPVIIDFQTSCRQTSLECACLGIFSRISFFTLSATIKEQLPDLICLLVISVVQYWIDFIDMESFTDFGRFVPSLNQIFPSVLSWGMFHSVTSVFSSKPHLCQRHL